MAQNTIETLTASAAGCWFDGARGIYIGEAVIAEAQAWGWNAKAAGYTERDLTVYGYEEDPKGDEEAYNWATDAAEEFLAGLAPEGFWVGFSEQGDFGMWESEED